MLGSDIQTSIKKGIKMKSLNLIMVFIFVVVTLLGCKDDTTESTPKPIGERLVFNVMALDHESMELTIQVRWLMGRLEKCLSELEMENGLEPIPFDWTEAAGFPKVKSKSKSRTIKPQTFYVPYPTIKRSKIKTEKRYANPEILSAYIEIQLSARKAYGMDKYIEHLEKRLKRLEEHLNK